MKKFMMMVAVAIMAAVNVNAQSAGEMYLKPMVGGTLSTLVGDADNAKMKVGLIAGFELGYNINERFGVTAGALYALQGAKNDDTDENMNLDYLNVPVLANVYVIPGLALKAGVKAGFLTRAKTKVNGEDFDFKDFMKKVDFSIPVGVSYEISDFIIDARYNIGVSQINKDEHDGWLSDGSVRNSVITLTVGYKIPY